MSRSMKDDHWERHEPGMDRGLLPAEIDMTSETEPVQLDVRPLVQRARTAFDRGHNPETTASALPMLTDIVAELARFQEISLEKTNQSASMLKRIDNKYVVDKSTLISVLDDLRKQFRILRIDERGIFSYESCYFDDRKRCFREHQQGRRHRFKVRTRLYVESNKAYFEVKLKGKRGQTEKSRETCDHFHDFAIDDNEQRMLCDLYEQSYKKAFRYDMKPALHVSYKRFTLVSASGGERITVDFSLGFETPAGRTVQIGDDFIIVETKSADGRGKADRVMKQRHVRQAEGCSKYCIGMVLTGGVEKHNKFRPIVKTVRSRMRAPDNGEERHEHQRRYGMGPTFLDAGMNRCSK